MTITEDKVILRDLIWLAERLGFRECHRVIGVRNVKGKAYNALSFRLEPSIERN